jgi:hypothetical protein
MDPASCFFIHPLCPPVTPSSQSKPSTCRNASSSRPVNGRGPHFATRLGCVLALGVSLLCSRGAVPGPTIDNNPHVAGKELCMGFSLCVWADRVAKAVTHTPCVGQVNMDRQAGVSLVQGECTHIRHVQIQLSYRVFDNLGQPPHHDATACLKSCTASK